MYVSNVNKTNFYSGLVGKGQASVKKGGSAPNSIDVSALPLDVLFNKLDVDRVDWIKVDVEGAEYEVLLGSEQVLRNWRPKLIVECTSDTFKLIQLMEELGYRSKPIAKNYLLFYPVR